MDSKLYQAAMSGKVERLEEVALTNPQILLSKAPQKNTALHIAARLGHASFVRKMLELCSQLVEMRNSQGDTPLHCAARAGRLEVVQILVEHCDAKPKPKLASPPNSDPLALKVEVQKKEAGDQPSFTDAEVGGGCGLVGKTSKIRPRAPPRLWPSPEEVSSVGCLRIPNNEWDTALHEALRNRHTDVAITLLDSDQELAWITNFAKESPLHLAVKEELREVVDSILSISLPGNPREASETIARGVKLGEKPERDSTAASKRELVAMKDYRGRTALHYGMWRNDVAVVDMILGIDNHVVPYSTDDEGFSPLHIGAAFGSGKAAEKLIDYCPDTIEQLDPKGRNLLHIGVLNHKLGGTKSLGIAIEKINERDEDGNTPLHLAAKYYGLFRFYRLVRKQEKAADLTLMNNRGQTALYISLFGILLPKCLISPSAPWRSRRLLEMPRVIPEKRLKKYGKEEKAKEQKNREGTYMVIATLIATVTFAAGLAVPGGFKSSDDGPKPGTATLADQIAFQLFMLFDAIAMCFSILAILSYLFRWQPRFGIRGYLLLTNLLTMRACIFMLLAFGMGTYAIISPRCRWLAILIFLICGVFPFVHVTLIVFFGCWLLVASARTGRKGHIFENIV